MTKKEYEEISKKIFDEWEEYYSKQKNNDLVIVEDGICNYDEYINAPKQIMFLLKEGNGGSENWNLCDVIRKGERAPTWDNIARWTKGILDLPNQCNWNKVSDIKNEKKEILAKVAAINIKKIAGKATANNKQLYTIASDKENIRLLKKQIKLCNPHIIICCGVYCKFYEEIALGTVVWNKTSNDVWYAIDEDRLVIRFNHPQARISPKSQYEKLMNAFNEISINHKNEQ